MNNQPATRISRRQFFTETARLACGSGLLGLGLVAYTGKTESHPATYIRPPGALDEKAFQATCVRCGLCVRDCPFDTLKLAHPYDQVATGTPFFEAREIPCEMCEDIPCVKACPTGALSPSLTDIDDARMGLAVLLDDENCLSMQGLRCDVCYRVCPSLDEAITLERERNIRTGAHAVFKPTVHSDKCTGCGKCERACVLDEAAIKVLPIHLAKGKMGQHYRFGWKEENIVDPVQIPKQARQSGLRPGAGS